MTAAIELFYDNGLRRKWQDDSTRTYSEWSYNGTLTLSRPYTAQENQQADDRARQGVTGGFESKVRQRAEQALQTNTDFLALDPPTNAQVLAQVRALTQEASALIRLVLRRFDSDA